MLHVLTHLGAFFLLVLFVQRLGGTRAEDHAGRLVAPADCFFDSFGWVEGREGPPSLDDEVGEAPTATGEGVLLYGDDVQGRSSVSRGGVRGGVRGRVRGGVPDDTYTYTYTYTLT